MRKKFKKAMLLLNLLLSTKLVKVVAPNSLLIIEDSLGIDRLGKMDFVCKEIKLKPTFLPEDEFNLIKGRRR